MKTFIQTWLPFLPTEDYITSQVSMFELEGTDAGHMRLISDTTVRMVAEVLRIKVHAHKTSELTQIGAVRALMCWKLPGSACVYNHSMTALEAYKIIVSGDALGCSFDGLAAVTIGTLRLNPELSVDKVVARVG